jgi:drug/metabolite transporter (DMT)-like permease
MHAASSSPVQPIWFVSVASLFLFFWASGFVAAKYGFPYAEPFTFLAIRFAIASALIVPFCFVCGATAPKGPRQYGAVILAGLGVQTVYLIGVYYAMYLGLSTGVMALIGGLQPLATGVLAVPLLGERVSGRQWFGLVLGFAGLAMVVAEKVLVGEAGAAAFGLAALALVAITLGTLAQKRWCAGFDLRAMLAIHNVVSLVLMAALAAAFENMTVAWSAPFVGALLWSAIGLSVLSTVFYYYLVRHGATARVTSLFYLSPPTTALMGWAAFGESMAALALAGMAVAALGVALATRGQ